MAVKIADNLQIFAHHLLIVETLHFAALTLKVVMTNS